MSHIPELSAGLKPHRKFFVQAKQVEKVDPKIAWLLRAYAVKICYADPKATQEDKAALISILDEIESNPVCAGLSQTERKDYLINFALNVFLVGDNQDRSGEATQSTAKCFLSASTFMEALKLFGSIDPDIDEKRKYAMWKAADIAKAIREGRKPTPGGFEESESELNEAFGIESKPVSNQPLPPPTITNTTTTTSTTAKSFPSTQSSTSFAQDQGEDPWESFNTKKQPSRSHSQSTTPKNDGSMVPPGFKQSNASVFDDNIDNNKSTSFNDDFHDNFNLDSTSQDPSKSIPDINVPSHSIFKDDFDAEISSEFQSKSIQTPSSSKDSKPPSFSDAHNSMNSHAMPQSLSKPDPKPNTRSNKTSKMASFDSDEDSWAEFYKLSGRNPDTIQSSSKKVDVSSRKNQFYSNNADNSITITTHPNHKDRHTSVSEASRLVRHVISALSFDDTPTAVDKLAEALALLLPYKDEYSEYS